MRVTRTTTERRRSARPEPSKRPLRSRPRMAVLPSRVGDADADADAAVDAGGARSAMERPAKPPPVLVLRRPEAKGPAPPRP
jgi:hypothetical protein